MYLKNANNGILQANNKRNRNDRGASEEHPGASVYYRCGEVVHECTTPLIHLTTGSGCLFEKFFLNFFWDFQVAYTFLKIFFIFLCKRWQEYVYLQCIRLMFALSY